MESQCRRLKTIATNFFVLLSLKAKAQASAFVKAGYKMKDFTLFTSSTPISPWR